MTEQEQQGIRNALVDNYSAYAEGLDSKNWPLVRGCFADEVLIDYGELSSASGAPDVLRRADDWMLYLKGVINGFDITRHLISNHRVTISEDEISCRAYLAADHVIFEDPAITIARPEDIVTVVGEYHNHYAAIDGAWRIVRSQLDVHYTHGNLALFVTAAERVAAAAG